MQKAVNVIKFMCAKVAEKKKIEKLNKSGFDPSSTQKSKSNKCSVVTNNYCLVFFLCGKPVISTI